MTRAHMMKAPVQRLLGGPPIAAGMESFAEHLARLGPAPRGNAAMISTLEASGLLGRGGAGFPVGRKWRAVAERSDARAVVLVNGAEGEPLSAKDRTLMTARPHLVLDGALLAAQSVGAEEVVLYVGSAHSGARAALSRAMAERSSTGESASWTRRPAMSPARRPPRFTLSLRRTHDRPHGRRGRSSAEFAVSRRSCRTSRPSPMRR
ncbi:MAG: hypothetical protein E6I45_09895 [Chloroflexi bacterium]|nr:MAG: hypothetical protein E6I45_09895 [Chloroflexota bacterium]